MQAFANLMQSAGSRRRHRSCVSYTIAFHVTVCDETHRLAGKYKNETSDGCFA